MAPAARASGPATSLPSTSPSTRAIAA